MTQIIIIIIIIITMVTTPLLNLLPIVMLMTSHISRAPHRLVVIAC